MLRNRISKIEIAFLKLNLKNASFLIATPHPNIPIIIKCLCNFKNPSQKQKRNAQWQKHCGPYCLVSMHFGGHLNMFQNCLVSVAERWTRIPLRLRRKGINRNGYNALAIENEASFKLHFKDAGPHLVWKKRAQILCCNFSKKYRGSTAEAVN